MLHFLGLIFADMTFEALKHCNCISNYNRNYTTQATANIARVVKVVKVVKLKMKSLSEL